MDAIKENYIMSYVVKPLNKYALESCIRTTLATFAKMNEMEQEINRLKSTLENRKLVEKAKYILMRDLNLSEPEAFHRLQKQSMDKGIPMKQLAEAIILNEELKNP
jgi:response regulator NasT